ncbi:MAG: hypothetical protein LBH37_03660 [Oscillospiraceae bacterium]|nr:hypothetical protein [Oscillospiraceae bacterium]
MCKNVHGYIYKLHVTIEKE